MTGSDLHAVGTRTGKVVHLTEKLSDWPWTLCGRAVKAPVVMAEPNCPKCVDRRDQQIGKRDHQLSINPVPLHVAWSDATGIKGSCSCGASEELPVTAKGTDLVVWHEAHVLAEVRSTPHPAPVPGVVHHDVARAANLTEETR